MSVAARHLSASSRLSTPSASEVSTGFGRGGTSSALSIEGTVVADPSFKSTVSLRCVVSLVSADATVDGTASAPTSPAAPAKALRLPIGSRIRRPNAQVIGGQSLKEDGRHEI